MFDEAKLESNRGFIIIGRDKVTIRIAQEIVLNHEYWERIKSNINRALIGKISFKI